MRPEMSIGEASRQSGVKIPTIRYYEGIGLLPRATRSAGNRRFYDGEMLRRLSFIRHARELGFEIEAIRTLLTLQDDPGQPCASADAIASARLAEVERRITSLTALKRELQSMLQQCQRGQISDCRVIESLTGVPA